ncbi:MAG TPA: CheR family methyltransferase [Blastocatellia bacterium]|nr:CheR family methyltransferase [Blastocatellia bacterium]
MSKNQDAPSARRAAQMRSNAPADEVAERAKAPEEKNSGHARANSGAKSGAEDAAQPAVRNGFNEILELLRRVTGVDFSLYKADTLRRRVRRRMILNNLGELEEYAEFLRDDPAELENLYQDVLIHVTRFFRDPGAFEVLKEKIFPRLVERRAPDEPVRIWVAGCSTGEEAYSIAMAFTEFAGERAERIPIQVFATDLDEKSIERARAGLYSKNIAEDVSPERLRRFFTKAEGGYRVGKPLREMLIFARQNVFADPPYSRMDLIACRNLLIFLEPALQKQILSLFHYALKPAGVLWLGSSETTGAASDLFEPEDKKHNFYARKPTTMRPRLSYPTGATGQPGQSGQPGQPGQPAARAERAPTSGAIEALQEVDRIILSRYAPASALIDEKMNILQLQGDTSPYLDQSHGKRTRNLLKLAHEGLPVALRQAVNKARKAVSPVRKENQHVTYGAVTGDVNLEVIPIMRPPSQRGHFLILFESVEAADQSDGRDARDERQKSDELRIEQLSQELAAAREYLRSVIEEYETTNEEFQSSNEEMQSVNEELETSKEELESSNEELIMLNDELNNRNAELGRLNSDLVNLLGSVQMPILMLDNQLRIRRFTPAAEKLLNLIQADVGRPIGDIRLNLDYPDLELLIAEAIDTVSGREVETRDGAGRWHSLRVRPYKTLDNRIDGAVVALVDIDALKKTELELARLAAIVKSSDDAVITVDLDGVITSWNQGAEWLYGYTAQEAVGHSFTMLIWPERFEVEKDILERLWRGEHLESFETVRRRKDGSEVAISLTVSPVKNAQGEVIGASRIARDITERKRAEEATRAAYEQESAALAEAERASRLKDEFLATVSHELRSPLNAILGWARMLSGKRLSEERSARALEIICNSARAQNQLISDLLDVSRIITGKLRIETRRIDLIPVIEAAMDVVRPAADAKRIRLASTLNPTAEPVLGDADRLQQVVWNLLSNAVKFTPAGGEVAVRFECEGGNVKLTVSDTGNGIEPEFLPFVFDRFRQFEGGTTRAAGGLGLGLAIVRHLVESHGGTVSAASRGRGQGAIFTVTLPLASLREEAGENERDRLAEAGEIPQSHIPSPELLRGLRVLAVDDDSDARNLLGLILRSYEAEVKACGSAAEALQIFDEWRPDVLVSDIGMPVEDGYDLMKKIRAREPERGGLIPALALTAYARAEDARQAFEAGYQAHIPKPVEPGELAKTVASLATQGKSSE